MSRELRAVVVCPRTTAGSGKHLFAPKLGSPNCQCGMTRERLARGGWGTWDTETRQWVEES